MSTVTTNRDRFAALDTLQRYAGLHGYRVHLITSEYGDATVSLIQENTQYTVASVTADRIDVAIEQTILQDTARRNLT